MKIVSLFSGCGGLDRGFEQAGFDIVWANENDNTIYATYRYNHPNTLLNTSDIRNIDAKEIPECDGIIGGPPCQAWSEGGKNLGLNDERGRLFFDYIRIVKEKQPKFFLIENVKGLLDSKHKSSLELFIKYLTESGYNITYKLLNSVDYKIPQERYRVFFVGIRKDLQKEFKFPEPVSKNIITLSRAIGDIQEQPRYYNVGDYVEDSLFNHDVYNGEYDLKYMSRNRVRSWNETSFTIQALARNAPIHPQAPKMEYISFNKRTFLKGSEYRYRRLSVRECARIQTFPDSFRFIYSNIADGYKMVGNAVPPRLAYYLAIQIKTLFE